MHSDPNPVSLRRPLRDRLGSNFYSHRAKFRCSRTLHHPVGSQHVNTRQDSFQAVNPPRMLQHPVGAHASARQERNRETQAMSVTEEESPQQTPSIVASEELKGKLEKGTAPASEEKKPVLLNIETFLERLGLSKYLVAFKAEEIDLYALKHMDEEDLKAIGLPMGPRKKVLYTVARLKAKK